jgi:hypothetical protein
VERFTSLASGNGLRPSGAALCGFWGEGKALKKQNSPFPSNQSPLEVAKPRTSSEALQQPKAFQRAKPAPAAKQLQNLKNRNLSITVF